MQFNTEFVLDDKSYMEFLAILNNPPEPTEALRKLMTTPWEDGGDGT